MGTANTKLLVVDDDEGMRSLLQQMLSAHFAVTAEPSGHAALARIRGGQRFDLILSDYSMPGMDGVSLHAEIEALDPGQAQRFAFLTACARGPLIAGVPEMSKPVGMKVLIEFVRECMRRGTRSWTRTADGSAENLEGSGSS